MDTTSPLEERLENQKALLNQDHPLHNSTTHHSESSSSSSDASPARNFSTGSSLASHPQDVQPHSESLPSTTVSMAEEFVSPAPVLAPTVSMADHESSASHPRIGNTVTPMDETSFQLPHSHPNQNASEAISTFSRDMPDHSPSTSPTPNHTGDDLENMSFEMLSDEPSDQRGQRVYLDRRPRTSYARMLYLAITSSKDGKMTLSQIYDWISERYPQYQDKEGSSGWKNSVRHNLSLNKSFKRIPRPVNEPGKGAYWTVVRPPNGLENEGRGATHGRRNQYGLRWQVEYQREVSAATKYYNGMQAWQAYLSEPNIYTHPYNQTPHPDIVVPRPSRIPRHPRMNPAMYPPSNSTGHVSRTEPQATQDMATQPPMSPPNISPVASSHEPTPPQAGSSATQPYMYTSTAPTDSYPTPYPAQPVPPGHHPPSYSYFTNPHESPLDTTSTSPTPHSQPYHVTHTAYNPNETLSRQSYRFAWNCFA